MRIVGGLDVHRAQITYDYVDLRTGEEVRGQIRPATRGEVRAFLATFGRKTAAFALEGTTGWRFIVEELRRAGMEAHLAEPAETRARRGPKRRAKTDRADSRLLRDLLLAGNLPESWIPPDHLADLRTTVRLRRALIAEKGMWLRRMHAQLFHHGLPVPPDLQSKAGREYLEKATLPPAARQVLDIGCLLLDRLEEQLDTIDAKLIPLARRLYGCEVLCRQWGIGPVLAATILAELGDTRRFSSSTPVGALRRDRRHRRGVRRQANERSSLPPGLTDTALGTLRGRRRRLAGGFARPQLLPRGQAAPRHETGPTFGRSAHLAPSPPRAR